MQVRHQFRIDVGIGQLAPRLTAPPTVPAVIRTILRHPSYREADRDIDFPARNDTRGVRLQLDYMNAEQQLEGRGVVHTIVVFRSTGIPEPGAASRIVAACLAEPAAKPDDPTLQNRLTIARRVLDKSRYYDIARRFGQLVGEAGDRTSRGRIMMMTCGGSGIMEAANRGAHDVGEKSIRLNVTLPDEQYPNPDISPELCFRFHHFAVRKLHFLLRARTLVVFPGGYGTMDEMFEVLARVQARKIGPLPIILVGESFWQGAFDADFLMAESVIDPENRELFWFAESAEKIWGGILRCYEVVGWPLLPAAGWQERH